MYEEEDSIEYMQNIKPKSLDFLYKWVSENKIPQIKKGMVEDLEAFAVAMLAEVESARSAERMQAQKPSEVVNEKDSSGK